VRGIAVQLRCTKSVYVVERKPHCATPKYVARRLGHYKCVADAGSPALSGLYTCNLFYRVFLYVPFLSQSKQRYIPNLHLPNATYKEMFSW